MHPHLGTSDCPSQSAALAAVSPPPPPPAQDVSDLRQQLDDLRQLVRDVVQQNGALLARMQPPPSSAQASEFSAHSNTSGYDAHPPPAPAAPPPPPERPPVQQPAPADPPRFDRADLKRLSTSLEPGRINRWISNFIDTAEDYSKQAAALLRMPTADARIATAHDEHLQSLDRWAARRLLQDPPKRPSASFQRGESFQSLADSMRHTPATASGNWSELRDR